MYTGWTIPFKVNRPLTLEERDRSLPCEHAAEVESGQRAALVKLNSTYIDWVDRRFLFRGTLNTFLATFVFVPLVVWMFGLFIQMPFMEKSNETYWWVLFIFPMMPIGMAGFLYYVPLRGEYFTYTYWPIRFNRKTRMVHVFRHNGAGGTLSIPWDQVFFHIGTDKQRPDDLDIRGHVLDGDIVKDTFALGHTIPKKHKRALLEMWEFIRRYMEEGPEAVGPHPLDRYVSLSVKPSLFNCFFMMHTYYVGGFPLIAQILAYPFVVLYTLTRWIVLRTCRKPVFPPEVEATCQIEPDDPNVWPVPSQCAEFVKTVPGLYEYAMAKEQRARKAEQQTLGK